MKEQKYQTRRTPRRSQALLWIAMAVFILLAALPSYSSSWLATLNGGPDQRAELPVGVLAQQPRKVLLTDLESFDQLRHQFQSESGKVRIISLLSPT
jgi:flagellar basal body-associated protein FliL